MQIMLNVQRFVEINAVIQTKARRNVAKGGICAALVTVASARARVRTNDLRTSVLMRADLRLAPRKEYSFLHRFARTAAAIARDR